MARQLWNGLMAVSKVHPLNNTFVRLYARNVPPCNTMAGNAPCRRAYDDIPPAVDPNCPIPCDRRKKKQSILHKIKLKVIEGGTNFGTPFRRLQLKKTDPAEEKEEPKEETKALSEAKGMVPAVPSVRTGVQVSVLGADTAVGQYIALLLKQCSCIKKLRLYEARDSQGCTRNLCSIVQDLQHINTNCLVEAFSCACHELERCLQNSDIVLILESGYISSDMSLETRFCTQAPIIRRYADSIAIECPKAFVIVCATPIDCMVPLIAETLKESGWYDPRKVLGSLAVPEMRASTLAANALCLEPRYTRVPCVGGTEGDSLVPLFSKALEYFDFAEYNAQMLTQAVRRASQDVTRCDGPCLQSADLSEAHALSRLVTQVAHALLCHDIPRVSGFVETDASQLVSPANYLAVDCLLNDKGICKRFDFPRKLSDFEVYLLELALYQLKNNVDRALCWFSDSQVGEFTRCQMQMKTHWHYPRSYDRLDTCSFHLN